MTDREEMIDVTTQLARVGDDLMVAIAADRVRSRRRRRTRLAALVAGVTLALVGTGVAATTGVFSPAPDSVKQRFDELDVAGVDASGAVEIGVIDEHAAFAAPTESGGFCLYFAEAERSGPSGSTCFVEPVPQGSIALNLSAGHDGGFVFGRVGDGSAVTVDVELPGEGGSVATPVVEEGFFLIDLPASAMPALLREDLFLAVITATARDAQGAIVARGRGRWADPGVPTETTETGPPPPSASGA
jgi:hypothetical protein